MSVFRRMPGRGPGQHRLSDGQGDGGADICSGTPSIQTPPTWAVWSIREGSLRGRKPWWHQVDVACGVTNYSPREAEDIFKAHSNVTYKYVHQSHPPLPPPSKEAHHGGYCPKNNNVIQYSCHGALWELWLRVLDDVIVLREFQQWGGMHDEAVKCVQWLLL